MDARLTLRFLLDVANVITETNVIMETTANCNFSVTGTTESLNKVKFYMEEHTPQVHCHIPNFPLICEGGWYGSPQNFQIQSNLWFLAPKGRRRHIQQY